MQLFAFLGTGEPRPNSLQCGTEFALQRHYLSDVHKLRLIRVSGTHTTSYWQHIWLSSSVLFAGYCAVAVLITHFYDIRRLVGGRLHCKSRLRLFDK